VSPGDFLFALAIAFLHNVLKATSPEAGYADPSVENIKNGRKRRQGLLLKTVGKQSGGAGFRVIGGQSAIEASCTWPE